MDMKDLVKNAFLDTVKFLPQEFMVMPLSRWNESVLRYYFCRFLARSSDKVEQRVECDRIDLVLRDLSNIAFVEFKLYLHPPRFDPYGLYGAKPCGYKGGAGRKNFGEFEKCVEKLQERQPQGHPLSKYIVLVYADPDDGRRYRYADNYDNYQHSNAGVPLQLVESSLPISTTEGIVQAKLYEIAEHA